MSRPSPLEHLPRLMAEADKTIAELRGEIGDLRERLEEVERDRNGVREQHSAIVSTARAIELERDEARAHHDHLRRSNDQLATQLRAVVEEREQLVEQAGRRLAAAGRRFGQLERERDGLRSTLEHADVALRNARTQVDDAHARARKVRDVLQGHYEMGDVDWPLLFAEVDAIVASTPSQPWIEGSLTLVDDERARELELAREVGNEVLAQQHRRLADLSLFAELTRNNGPRIRIWEVRGMVEPGKPIEQGVLELMRGMARVLLEPKLPDHVAERLEVTDDIHAIVADGLERERIMRPVADVMRELAADVAIEIDGRRRELGPPVSGRLIEQPPGWLADTQLREVIDAISKTLRDEPAAEWLALPRRAGQMLVALATAPLYKPLQGDRGVVALAKRWVAQNQLITTDDVEVEPDLPPCPSCGKPTRAIDRIGSAIRHVNDENAMRDRIPRRIFGDATVAATAATMLLEFLQMLRARLAHASTELQHRAEPAPEVDDVGAACAVLAEDLDGIVIEIDRVLEAVPR